MEDAASKETSLHADSDVAGATGGAEPVENREENEPVISESEADIFYLIKLVYIIL